MKTFAGSFVIQMYCHNCGNIETNRPQHMHCMTLEVKKQNNLKQSLKNFSADQKEIEWCDCCDNETKQTSFSVFKKLPEVLIFHLNRFEIHYDQKIKDNSRFEFPDEIDMHPYTMEFEKSDGRSKKKEMYALKGVVVHSGTIHGGHYFSFIKNEYN